MMQVKLNGHYMLGVTNIASQGGGLRVAHWKAAP